MKIDVHARRFKLTEALRVAVHREIARLTQAVGAGITGVSVRLFDVNGLRGGPDKGCLVHAQFTDGTSVDADYTKSHEHMKNEAMNPNDTIYLQYLLEDPTDINKYPQYASFAEKEPPYNLCFSNAGVNNPSCGGVCRHARAG